MKRRLPLVLDAPGPVCSAPASDRFCVASGCPDNLGARLGPGQHHPTRCARDGIEQAPGFARQFGEVRDCGRYDDCLDALVAVEELEEQIARSRRAVPRARSCPKGCMGFVPVGRAVA